jgi:hypothetical protein
MVFKMEIKKVNRLSDRLLRIYGDRKQSGRLDLVYDIGAERFYAVPRNIEHKDFMPQIETEDPESLVPIQLRYVQNGHKVLTDLLVGASSYEADCGVRHPWSYLKRAYEETLLFLNKHQDFEINSETRLEIMQKFAKLN